MCVCPYTSDIREEDSLHSKSKISIEYILDIQEGGMKWMK